MFPTSVCFANYSKKISHLAYLRGTIGRSYPIYTCAVVADFTLTNHLAVYSETPLLMIPQCVHCVAPKNHFTISTS